MSRNRLEIEISLTESVFGTACKYVKMLIFLVLRLLFVNKAGNTATDVACGWAGAVIKKANLSVWAGAVVEKTPENAEKANGDGRTDQPTAGHSAK